MIRIVVFGNTDERHDLLLQAVPLLTRNVVPTVS